MLFLTAAIYCGGMDQKISCLPPEVNGSLSTGLPLARTGRPWRWNEAEPARSARASANSTVSEAGTKPRRIGRASEGRM